MLLGVFCSLLSRWAATSPSSACSAWRRRSGCRPARTSKESTHGDRCSTSGAIITQAAATAVHEGFFIGVRACRVFFLIHNKTSRTRKRAIIIIKPAWARVCRAIQCRLWELRAGLPALTWCTLGCVLVVSLLDLSTAEKWVVPSPAHQSHHLDQALHCP